MPPRSSDLLGRVSHWVTLIIGLVVAGEALALLIGMNSPRPSEWSTVKNNGLAMTDVVTGVLLVYLVLARRNTQSSFLFYVLLSVVLISHGYRGWEYLVNRPNKFCANLPLFVVNTVKLIGSLGVLGMSLFT